ncbi:retinol dehydrogenase 7-like [Ruditapes philippinarum]|uniref:retinol dehydrogenase 7-like n=1 Tax=Ruditapes philippinarum TaxID=129788 RepID=UPI00295B78D2|nr:retinol dehydrogenase 7-like [Ruditapes philippinarum]
MLPFQHLPTMNFIIDDNDIPEDDVILYSVLYSSVTVVFAMAVLSKFLTNEFRFGFRSVLSLAVLFLGEPLCQFFVKGPVGVGCFAFGCLLIYSILPASHLPAADKAVLITGCDSGFGLALVKKLDSIGMRVFAGCLDKDGTGAAAIRNNCSNRVHILQLDVTNEKEISAAVHVVTSQVGEQGLWGLVNNAGIWYFSELEMMSETIIKKIIDVNLFGAIRMTKSLLPLIRQAKGRIINVSSVLGRISMEGHGAYGISKHGLVAFSDTLRQEMKKWNVKVSIIEPTGYSTNNNHSHSLRYKREEIWDTLDEEGRKTYGREYLDEVYNSLFDTLHRFPDDLTPVIRAMRSSLLSKRPRERYPCGAGADIITYIHCLVPVWLADKVSSSFGLMSKTAKPAQLQEL